METTAKEAVSLRYAEDGRGQHDATISSMISAAGLEYATGTIIEAVERQKLMIDEREA